MQFVGTIPEMNYPFDIVDSDFREEKTARLNTTFPTDVKILLKKMSRYTGLGINKLLIMGFFDYLRGNEIIENMNVAIVEKDQYDKDMQRLQDLETLFENYDPAKMESIIEERNNLQKECNKKDLLISRLENRIENKKDIGNFIIDNFVTGLSFDTLMDGFEGITTTEDKLKLLSIHMDYNAREHTFEYSKANKLNVFSFRNLKLKDYVVVSNTELPLNGSIIKKSEVTEYTRTFGMNEDEKRWYFLANKHGISYDVARSIDQAGISYELHETRVKLSKTFETLYSEIKSDTEFTKLWHECSTCNTFEGLESVRLRLNEWLKRNGHSEL